MSAAVSANAMASGGTSGLGDAAAAGQTVGAGTGSGSGSPRRPASRLRAAFSAMRSRVRSVADATWGTTRQLGRRPAGRRRASAPDRSRPGRRPTDARSAAPRSAPPGPRPGPRDVLMSTAPGLHPGERGRIDEMPRLGAQADVDAHEVALGQQVIEGRRRSPPAPIRPPPAPVCGWCTGCACRSRGRAWPSRDRCARSRRCPAWRPRHVPAKEQQRSPRHPAVVTHEGVRLRDPPRDREQQREWRGPRWPPSARPGCCPPGCRAARTRRHRCCRSRPRSC